MYSSNESSDDNKRSSPCLVSKKHKKIQTIETTNHAQKIKQPKYKGREKEWNPLRQMPRFVVSIVRNGYHIRLVIVFIITEKTTTHILFLRQNKNNQIENIRRVNIKSNEDKNIFHKQKNKYRS